MSQAHPDVALVRADFETILRLNPNDVSLHVRYGDALERFGLAAEARDQYQAALKADSALPLGEPKRLTAEHVQELRRKSG